MNDLLCTFCEGVLDNKGEDEYLCNKCGQEFPVLFGVPYIYKYQLSDLLSLIEIEANKQLLKTSPFSKEGLTLWNELLKQIYFSENRKQSVENAPDWSVPWVEIRLREFDVFKTLTNKIELKNKKVLDVGAGLGFDSFTLLSEGSEVTAFEYSPVLGKCGKEAVPDIHWVGGSASNLPFANGQFDFVFCNAALHHISDVDGALMEMLRVVKVGGCVFTISDTYANSLAPSDFELEIFDNHTDVLSGINESIISINKIVDFFQKYDDCIDVEVVAHRMNAHLPKDSALCNKFDEHGLIRFSYKEHVEDVKNYFDGLSFRITLKRPIVLNRRLLDKKNIIIEPREFIDSICFDNSKGIKLTNFLPNEYVDVNLLSNKHNKFMLLNGLQKPSLLNLWRSAYKKMQLVYSSSRGYCCFAVRMSNGNGTLDISVNNIESVKISLNRNWNKIKVKLDKESKRSVIKFRLNSNNDFFQISNLPVFILECELFNKLIDFVKVFLGKAKCLMR